MLDCYFTAPFNFVGFTKIIELDLQICRDRWKAVLRDVGALKGDAGVEL